jgi:hypothetical protein
MARALNFFKLHLHLAHHFLELKVFLGSNKRVLVFQTLIVYSAILQGPDFGHQLDSCSLTLRQEGQVSSTITKVCLLNPHLSEVKMLKKAQAKKTEQGKIKVDHRDEKCN